MLLAGIRVLDFGRYIAGPYCACLLADLGADVIRVEKIAGSEDRLLIPVAHNDGGAMFLQSNRNKRSLTLDPTNPDGARIVRDLVSEADVVVANAPRQILARMGIDYESLAQINPHIILTTIDAYDEPGPWSDRLGFDGVGQAICGSAFLSGDPDLPSKSYVPWVDFLAATIAAFGTMAALAERERTGRGQHVHSSLLASALTVANSALIEQSVIGPNRVATQNRSQVAAPADIFRTTDGWVIVQVVGDQLFRRWVGLMGEEQWLTDSRFASDQSRGDHRDTLCQAMAAWCSVRSTATALDELAAVGIPAGPVYSPQQVLDDPHIRATGLLKPTPYPETPSPPPLVDTPVSFSVTAAGIHHRPPRLGEHTDQILSELGYTTTAIARLRDEAVI
ncbi:MAG: CoA transferase [Acidimicrobiia bacterium]